MGFASDLHQQLANGEVCAFAGAGLSMGAGLPGWYDLISQLSQRIGYDLPPAKWATSDTKQIYEEERAEWAAERETVAGKMSEIERRLGT